MPVKNLVSLCLEKSDGIDWLQSKLKFSTSRQKLYLIQDQDFRVKDRDQDQDVGSGFCDIQRPRPKSRDLQGSIVHPHNQTTGFVCSVDTRLPKARCVDECYIITCIKPG